MRKITIVVILLSSFHFSFSQSSEVRLKIDSGTQCQIRYHYFPNLEAYFDLSTQTYLYHDKGKWISAEEIPNGFRGYSIYNKSNVPITDYDDDNIIQFINAHRQKFPYVNGRKTRELTASVN